VILGRELVREETPEGLADDRAAVLSQAVDVGVELPQELLWNPDRDLSPVPDLA
jgi:hypothetical protein